MFTTTSLINQSIIQMIVSLLWPTKEAPRWKPETSRTRRPTSSKSSLIFLALIIASNSVCGGNQGPSNPPPPDGRVEKLNIGACNEINLYDPAPCPPCKKENWLEHFLLEREDNLTTREQGTCYNARPFAIPIPVLKPIDVTRGSLVPNLKATRKSTRGFIIPQTPFFRFFDTDKLQGTCSAGGSTSTDQDLDIGRVRRYYLADRGAGSASSSQQQQGGSPSPPPDSKRTVDVQLLEWPGQSHELLVSHLKEQTNERYECNKTEERNQPKHPACDANYQMLRLQRGASKILPYPCNKHEGTKITAVGLISQDQTMDQEISESRIYLSLTSDSIHLRYIEPLYVSQHILMEMAKSNDSKSNPGAICFPPDEELIDCDFTVTKPPPQPSGRSENGNETTTTPTAEEVKNNTRAELCERRKAYFERRGEIIIKKDCDGGNPPSAPSPSGRSDSPGSSNSSTNSPPAPPPAPPHKTIINDLSTVLDFTFVENRLVLAMRCGILVVKNILRRQVDFHVAPLLSRIGSHKNTYSPVSKISSSICCGKAVTCKRSVIAAYAGFANQGVDEPKEIYVSFDLGDTFVTKLVAEPNSALNLMWGMYKMYGDWIIYHDILERPDPEDMRSEAGEEHYEGYEELRSVPEWDTLTLQEKEKRLIYGESDPQLLNLDARKKALRRFIKMRSTGSLARFARYRRMDRTIELDLSPEWLKQEIRQNKNRSAVLWRRTWTDWNCDSVLKCRRHFINDPAVDYFLKDSNVIVKTPKRNPDEAFCDQIVSIAVLEEEDALYALCVIGYGDFNHQYNSSREAVRDDGAKYSCNSRYLETMDDGKPSCYLELEVKNQDKPTMRKYHYNKCTQDIKLYAIFSMSIKEKLPLVIVTEQRSNQLFTCPQINRPLDPDGCKTLAVDPEIVRLPTSISILIQNCKEVLYFSPNGGRSVFHTAFLAHQSEFPDQSDRHGSDCEISQQTEPPSEGNHIQHMYKLKSLNHPPVTAVSPVGSMVFMTMGNKYAFGIFGVHQDFKMIVGEIFPKDNETTMSVLDQLNSTDFVFPGFMMDNRPLLSVGLVSVYSGRSKTCKLFEKRVGLRLVKKELYFYRDVANIYEENQDLTDVARLRGFYADVCTTFSLKAHPLNLFLDVDEGGIVRVRAMNSQPSLALGLLSSEERSILVDVFKVNNERKVQKHSLQGSHEWDIHITALKHEKKRITALVDSFYGVENNNLDGVDTEINLSSNLDFRCHVQPTTSVTVHIGCHGKKMVAHEPEYRPQCTSGIFSKKLFKYRLKKGEFNPKFVAYWKELEISEGKSDSSFFFDTQTEELEVTYDYLRFGCPLEPYKTDPFIPDLRIASASSGHNGSAADLYNGSFLLVELFGASGFSFSQTYEDKGCKFVPLNTTEVLEDWFHRQRMFYIAQKRQKTVTTDEQLDGVETVEELENLEIGNRLFQPEAVQHPTNIINRVTYKDCTELPNLATESEKAEQRFYDKVNEENKDNLLSQQLPVMSRDGDNTIQWAKKNQRIYIFMALALDPTESLCEYYTIFGVSLPAEEETSPYITLLIFLILLLLWIALFFCGFYYRKSRIRTRCIELERKRRLEEAAWKVVYEYEKLLREAENHKIEAEFADFRDRERQKKAKLDSGEMKKKMKRFQSKSKK